MKSLVKVGLILAAIFASTFVFAKFFGLFSVEQVQGWLAALRNISSFWVALLVVTLLFADLFIAIPTLTITILSGHFLGFQLGAFAATAGMTLAGTVGYVLSRLFGHRMLHFILKDESQRDDLTRSFQNNGFVMILLSRALPILPEVTACLAGVTRMKPTLFALAWALASIPYAVIAAYAGSISTLENPKPALFTAIILSATLWLCWWLYCRHRKPVE